MLKTIALVICMISLTACLYKVDIQQGNILEIEKLSQLKTGMKKSEVVALLGTPQLKDPFHNERWDYFYSNATDNQTIKTNSIVTLHFKQDKLVEIIQ